MYRRFGRRDRPHPLVHILTLPFSCRRAAPCLSRCPTRPRQGLDGPNSNSRFSYLAQKRRSSLSELTAFFQDLVDDGESSRMIANLPSLGGEGGGGGGGFPPREGNGNGNRVTFKRTAPEDFDAYGEYGMDGSGRSCGRSSSVESSSGLGTADDGTGGSNGIGGGGPAWAGGSGGGGGGNSQLKRARGGPEFQDGEGGGGGGADAERCRRMSERMSAKVAARNPMVVQAVTCLASGVLPESDESEDNTEDVKVAAGEEGAAALSPSSSVGQQQRHGGGGRDASGVVKKEELAHTISDETFNSEEAVKAAQDMSTTTMPAPPAPPAPARRRSTINDIMTTCSTQQAMEQVREGGGDEADGEGKQVQRASIYLLMHAMAAVDAASDEPYGDEEPLDGVDGMEKYAEAAI